MSYFKFACLAEDTRHADRKRESVFILICWVFVLLSIVSTFS